MILQSITNVVLTLDENGRLVKCRIIFFDMFKKRNECGIFCKLTGVNIFFEINRRLASIMDSQPQYDVSIEEIHHTEKLDAPSGTAIRTAEVILDHLSNKSKWQLAGAVQATSDTVSSLLITAKREPKVPGTHVVTYSSGVDEIQVIHQAKTRRGFAEGAVMAARWMSGRHGVYEMKDLLSF